MGIFVDIKKVKGGFQYYAGQLCIGKSIWIQVGSEWKLQLWHMQTAPGRHLLAEVFPVQTFDKPKDVLQYLSDITTRELK